MGCICITRRKMRCEVAAAFRCEKHKRIRCPICFEGVRDSYLDPVFVEVDILTVGKKYFVGASIQDVHRGVSQMYNPRACTLRVIDEGTFRSQGPQQQIDQTIEEIRFGLAYSCMVFVD